MKFISFLLFSYYLFSSYYLLFYITEHKYLYITYTTWKMKIAMVGPRMARIKGNAFVQMTDQ